MASIIHQIFTRSAEQMRAGKFDEARLGFQEILRRNSDHVDTLVHLAQIESSTGHHWEAIELLSRAVRLRKSDAMLRYRLGQACYVSREFPQAIAAYQKAIDLQPNVFEFHFALGDLFNLLNSMPQALEHLQRACQIRPNDPGPMIAMTTLLLKLGKIDEALAVSRRAVALAPQSAITHHNYANALLTNNQAAQAVDEFRMASACDPSSGPLHHNLGLALVALGDLDQAVLHFQQCIELSPEFPSAWGSITRALGLLGQVPRAIDLTRQALRLHPSIGLWNALLLCLSYTNISQEKILDEHLEMLRHFSADLKPGAVRVSQAGRPIRVGYLSPDFCDHPVAYFVEPLLKHHDQKRFELFCYATSNKSDGVTQRLKTYPVAWRDITNLADPEAITLIQHDQLDILIDLAGHTSGNRISLLLGRLAGLQISYLGYPTTTGLPTLDVRLTDTVIDPPGKNDAFYSERLVQLPGCFCCFNPPADAPAMSPLPARTSGQITFGSLHSLAKINDGVLDLWAAVVKAVPNSRLLIFRNSLSLGTQARLITAFEKRGIDASRLLLRSERPADGYLSIYHDIDISLDTFPFTGHTTACQSLFMGVPILTLIGDSSRHRFVSSILQHAGFPQFVASNHAEYVSLAQSLATDLNRLADLRQTLRGRMLQSPLCDAPTFTKQFESTLVSLLDEPTSKESAKSAGRYFS